MLAIPLALGRLYDTLRERTGVAAEYRPHYRKWLRFYWDFCHKYNVEPTARQSFPAFRDKLRTQNQSAAQIKQAYHAISLYKSRGQVLPFAVRRLFTIQLTRE